MDHDALPLPAAATAAIDEAAWREWIALPESARAPEDLYLWWSTPELRHDLYQRIARLGPPPGRVAFSGWATRTADTTGALPPPHTWLVTGDEALRVLLTPETFSSAPYRALAHSELLLNMDGAPHQQRRAQAQRWLAQTGMTAANVQQTADRAISDHLMPHLGTSLVGFDLVPVAKQLVMAYFLELFGLPETTQSSFAQAFDQSYERLNHLLVGRHVEHPDLAAQPAAPLGRFGVLLVIVIARLVQATGDLPLPGAAADASRPLLDRLAERLRDTADPVEVTQAIPSLAVLVMEMMGGAYGQTVSAMCKGLQSAERRRRYGTGLETLACLERGDLGDRRRCVLDLLADDPPAPILNRRVVRDERGYRAGDEVLVAIDDLPRKPRPDLGLSEDALTEARTFGLGHHQCLGRGSAGSGGASWGEFPDLITPLIGSAIASILAHADRHPTLKIGPLTLRWGGLCEAFPVGGK